jgi:hypothetical protein
LPQIKADTFPAIITVAPPGLLAPEDVLSSAPASPGSFQIHTSRVIVTEDRVVIARDSVNGPELVFSELYDPASLQKAPKKADDSYLTTLSGKRLAFKKDESCGCGSRLRSWNPFAGSIMSSKNPTE